MVVFQFACCRTPVGSALAEDFSLRNGIVFGDSPDDVKSKETTLSLRDTNHDNVMIAGIIDVNYGEAPFTQRFVGPILGLNEEFTLFFYNEENKLYDMMYVVDLADDPQIYEKLTESLTSKYGAPLGNVGETFCNWSCIHGSKLRSCCIRGMDDSL